MGLHDKKLGYTNFLGLMEASIYKKLYIGGTLAGFFLRMFYALTATGIYHPDEIFQSLEMAHYLVYGYGFIPPEFMLSNPDTPSYAKARSWIIPLMIAGIMYIGEFLHLPYWGGILPLVRVLVGLNSFLLIPATRKLGENISGDSKIGYLSGFFVAIWWKIAYITSRPLFNVIFLPIFIYAIAVFYERRIEFSSEPISLKEWIVYFFGFGISTYVRVDFLIILFGFAVVHQWSDVLEGNKEKFKNDLSYLLTPASLGWLFGMTIDAFMYEGLKDFGVVPVQWFKFNILEGRSDDFGVVPFGWYAYRLVIENGLTLVSVTMLLFFLFVVNVYRRRRELLVVIFPNSRLLKEFSRLFVVVIISWMIYETPWRSGLLFWNSASHKEERFVMNLYILYFVLIAMFVFLFGEFMEKVLSASSGSKKSKLPKINPQSLYHGIVFVFILFISLSSLFHMVFTPVFQFGTDINSGITYVGKQEDLEGLIIVEKWFLTGAYTYLHQDVPVYWVNSTYTYELTVGFNEGKYNYLILPRYKYWEIPNLFDTLVDDGWLIHKIVDGKTEIWFKP